MYQSKPNKDITKYAIHLGQNVSNIITTNQANKNQIPKSTFISLSLL